MFKQAASKVKALPTATKVIIASIILLSGSAVAATNSNEPTIATTSASNCVAKETLATETKTVPFVGTQTDDSNLAKGTTSVKT